MPDIKDTAKKIAETAADKAETLAIIAKSSAARVQDAADRAVHVAGDIDIWNLGNYLIRRYSDMLRHLSEMSYSDVDMAWFDKLRPTSEAIANFDDAMDAIEHAAFSTSSAPLDKEKYLSMMEDLFASFRENWNWIGQNIFTEAYHAPNPPYESENAVIKTARILTCQTGAAIKRAAGKEAFSSCEIDNLYSKELLFLSHLLYRFAEMSIGCPSPYANTENVLFSRDEKWAAKQCHAVFLFAGEDISETMVEKAEHGSVRPLENSSDPDLCAWIEDIVVAAGDIAAWADWSGSAGSAEKLRKAGVDEEEISMLSDARKAAFLNAWDWIGKNIAALWV